MSSPTSTPNRWLVRIIVGLSVLYVATFLICAVARVFYPYELDFCEGALAAVVARVTAGLPIYVPPGIHFTSMVYTPLDFFIAAVVNRLHPGDYFGLRLTSLLSTILTGAIIAIVSRRHRAPWWATAAALGTFFAASSRCDFIQDSAHVDAPALAFTFCGLAILFEGRRTIGWAAVAGALAGLGFLTKQTMVVFVAIPAVWLLVQRQWARAIAFAAVAALVAVGLLARWQLLDNPWFVFWVFKLESSLKLRFMKVLVYAPAYLIVCLPAALVIGVAGKALGAPVGTNGLVDVVKKCWADPWAVCFTAFAGLSFLAKGKDGGGENVFLPVFALGALQIGRHAHRLVEARPRAVSTMLAVQLVLLFCPPTLPWPTRANTEEGDRIVAQIAKFPGEVYVPAFPAYAVRAGKSWWVHYTIICGLSQFDPTLRNELAEQIRDQRFAAIFPRDDVEPADRGICDPPDLDKYYEPMGPAESVGTSRRPSLLDVLSARPSVAGIAHGGKLGRIYVPRRLTIDTGNGGKVRSSPTR